MTTAHELAGRLASLYRDERTAMADFLLALAAFDERKAWRELGFPSLWSFLRQELKLSKSAAFHRKTAAELIQAHPAVADALRAGDHCSSSGPCSRARTCRPVHPERRAGLWPARSRRVLRALAQGGRSRVRVAPPSAGHPYP
jgi:hypothetical protein